MTRKPWLNGRRRGLLVVLFVLLMLPLVLVVGTVEEMIWLLLLALWLYAFFGWASDKRSHRGD